MTPERLQALREVAEEGKRYGDHFMPDDVLELLGHIDRLNAALTEARLSVEEAWDAHDEKEEL